MAFHSPAALQQTQSWHVQRRTENTAEFWDVGGINSYSLHTQKVETAVTRFFPHAICSRKHAEKNRQPIDEEIFSPAGR